jgi:hypothetical protein
VAAGGPFFELVARRRSDWQRHVEDLVGQRYEGAAERPARDHVFRTAFELCTPVALRVLERANELLLGGTATLSTEAPQPDGAGGLLGGWRMSWPLLEQARNRFTGKPLPPVEITAMFPDGFTHGHLALYDLADPRRWVAAWPLQVTSPEDAERQEPILWAIAEAEVHERTYAGDLNWRLLGFEPGSAAS